MSAWYTVGIRYTIFPRPPLHSFLEQIPALHQQLYPRFVTTNTPLESSLLILLYTNPVGATRPTRVTKSDMEHFVSVFGVAVAVFTSTNLDDMFVLLGFFSDPKFRSRQVVIGQYFGIGTLFGLSVVASLVSLVIPTAYVGLLGLAPIMIGLRKAWSLRNGMDSSVEE